MGCQHNVYRLFSLRAIQLEGRYIFFPNKCCPLFHPFYKKNKPTNNYDVYFNLNNFQPIYARPRWQINYYFNQYTF